MRPLETASLWMAFVVMCMCTLRPLVKESFSRVGSTRRCTRHHLDPTRVKSPDAYREFVGSLHPARRFTKKTGPPRPPAFNGNSCRRRRHAFSETIRVGCIVPCSAVVLHGRLVRSFFSIRGCDRFDVSDAYCRTTGSCMRLIGRLMPCSSLPLRYLPQCSRCSSCGSQLHGLDRALRL